MSSNAPATIATPAVVASRHVVIKTVDTVLVKFYFTNPAHIPPGLPRGEISSIGAKANDAFNAMVAKTQGKEELAQVGRVREDRVDTGFQTVNNLQLVQLGVLRRGLTNVGYQLRKCYSFVKDPTRTSSKKFVVVLVFQSGGYYEDTQATPSERAAHQKLHSPEVAQALVELAKVTWQYVHVWDNHDTRKTATINVGGRLPGVKPKNAIAVRAGEIIPIPLTDSLAESEE